MKENELSEIKDAPLQDVTLDEPKELIVELPLKKYVNYTEQAKDFVTVAATKKAVEDKQLINKIVEQKKDELIAKAEADNKEERAKLKDAEKKLQDANFGVFSGVMSYAGVKRALPNAMQRILAIPLQIIQIALFLIFGTITSVLTIIMDAVNTVAERFALLAKSAKNIVITLAVIFAIAIVFLILIRVLIIFDIKVF